MDLKKLLMILIAVLSLVALLCCMQFARGLAAPGAVGGINPPTGDYLNVAIYASFGVLALLLVLLTSTARSKRR